MELHDLTFEERDRASLLGASEVATVLGFAPASWGGPLDVWARKVKGVDDFTGNKHTRWGERLERVIVEAIGEEFDADDVVYMDHGPHDPFVTHPDWPLLGTHPDAFLVKDGVWYAVEAKKSMQYGAFGDGDDMPPHYWIQCQVHAALTGMPVLFGAYETTKDNLWLRVIEVDPDVGMLLGKAERWFERHVIHGETPPLEGEAGIKHVLREHPDAGKIVIDADTQQEATISSWRELKRMQAEIGVAEKSARAAVLDMIGGDLGICSDLGTAKWGSTKARQTVSLSDMKKHSDVLALLQEHGLIKQGKPGRTLRWSASKGGK